MPNSELAEGVAYFQNAFFVELIFRYLSRMRTQDRKLLGKYLRELLNAPQTVSEPPRPRRTKPRIDRTPPKPRPATFPDRTDTELKDEIYMSRLRKAYWLRRLRYAGAQLRKAKFDDKFRDGADSTERKNLAEEAARIRERIRGYNERIKAYEKALKEPHRDKGPTRTYDPIKPEADLPTVEEAVLQMLSEKLERSIKELQKRDEQLKGAGSEEIEYINQLRRLMDKLDDEIGRLQEQIEFIERLRRQDRKTDEDLALGPMVTEPPDYSGADLAAELNGALRRGIDIWALARRHGLDLTKPATGVTGNSVTIPWEKSIYAGALIHDDLYGKVHASQGGPGTGDLVFRFRFGRDAGEGNFGLLDPGLVRRRTGGNLIPVRPFTPRLPVGANGNEAANIIDLSNGPLAPRRPFTPQHPRSA
jgi:tetratricopeptide (TPR) repeat protein